MNTYVGSYGIFISPAIEWSSQTSKTKDLIINLILSQKHPVGLIKKQNTPMLVI